MFKGSINATTDEFLDKVASFLDLPRDVVAAMPLRAVAQLTLEKSGRARTVVNTTGETAPSSRPGKAA